MIWNYADSSYQRHHKIFHIKGKRYYLELPVLTGYAPVGFPQTGTEPLQNPVDKHSSILAPWMARPGAQSNLTWNHPEYLNIASGAIVFIELILNQYGSDPISKFKRKILLYSGIDHSGQSRDPFTLCDSVHSSEE